MKVLNIKNIKNAELLTARLLNERIKGNFDVHTKHTNQTNKILLKLQETDIHTLTKEDQEEIGEFINKVQELVNLIDSNDITHFTKILETDPILKKKYSKEEILNIISRENYNSRETYNLRMKAYSHALELNINTCHSIINQYKSNNIGSYNNIKLYNLIESIYNGLSPEEIRIIFGLSDKETSLLTKTLYKERDELFSSLGNKYSDWQNVFEKHSQKVLELLNKRLQGEITSTLDSNLNYKSNGGKMFDMENVESAINAAEVSVRILFFLKLYPSMSLKTLKTQLEELVSKEHEWSKTQLQEIKALGKTKAQYVKEIKEILKDKTEESLLQMKSKTIAAICQLDDETADIVTNMFVMMEPQEVSLSFEDITNIIILMRTNIKTECIQYMYMLDDDTIQLIKKLFKIRIEEKSANLGD